MNYKYMKFIIMNIYMYINLQVVVTRNNHTHDVVTKLDKTRQTWS